MKWSILFFVFAIVFAPNLTKIIDTDLGYVEVNGFVEKEGFFELAAQEITVKIVSTREFILLNYSLSITPRNLERLALEYGVPLRSDVDKLVPAGSMEEFTLELPDIVCGTYKATGDIYYLLGNSTQVMTDNLHVKIPCKDFRSRLVYGLVSRLPYPILTGLMRILGIRFT